MIAKLFLKLGAVYEQRNSTVVRRFLPDGLMGCVSTLVDWGSYYIFLVFFGLHYHVSATGSFALGSTCNFALNDHVTFRCETDASGIQIGYFVRISIFALTMPVILSYLQVDVLGLKREDYLNSI